MGAVAIGRGQFFPPSRFTKIAYLDEVRVPGTYVAMSERSSCFTARPEVSAKCADDVAIDRGLRPALTAATRYPPVYFLVVAPVTRALGAVQAIYGMRLLTAVMGAALLAVAFVTAQSLGRWAVLGVAAATTPMTIYLTSVVNPSGLELTSAIALWTLSCALARRRTIDRPVVAGVAVTFAVFANTRGFSLPLAVIALVLPLAMTSRRRLEALAADRTVRRWGVVVGLAALAGASWGLLRGRVSRIEDTAVITVWEGIERTWTLFEECVAWFGLVEVRVLAAVFVWLGLWGALLVLGIRRGTHRDRLVVGSLVLLGVALPVVVSLLGPPPIYRRFHGRYILPLWVGLPILCGVVASSGRDVVTRFARRGWALAGVLVALGHVIAFATAARRYAVGTDGSILYVIDPVWTGPAPAIVSLVLATAGAVALAVLLTRAGTASLAAAPVRGAGVTADASR
jgi:hypothetical protein